MTERYYQHNPINSYHKENIEFPYAEDPDFATGKGKGKQIKYYKNKPKSMTICIATIADYNAGDSGNNSKIVFCADRKIDNNYAIKDPDDTDRANFSSDNTKIYKLTDYCKVMQASDDLNDGYEVIQNVIDKISHIKDKKMKIDEILSLVEKEYVNQLSENTIKRVNKKEILSEGELNEIFNIFNKGINNGKPLFNRKYTPKEARYLTWVGGRINLYKATRGDTSYLLFGYDYNSDSEVVPKIYTVYPDIKSSPRNQEGYATIGSGSVWSEYQLALRKCSPRMNCIDAIVNTYLAKKTSEGYKTRVGLETEIGIMYPTINKEGKVEIKTKYLLSPKLPQTEISLRIENALLRLETAYLKSVLEPKDDDKEARQELTDILKSGGLV